MKLLSYIFIILLCVSCSEFEQAKIRTFERSDGRLNLANELNGDWDKVCFITPYMDNETAKNIIGFYFDVEAVSGITDLDSITLLVTIKQNQLIEYVEIPRNNIDLSSLDAHCYLREQAQFKIVLDNKGRASIALLKSAISKR